MRVSIRWMSVFDVSRTPNRTRNGTWVKQMENPSDQALIRQARNGHPEAFDRLVERYGTRIYNAVYRQVGNANDASDIVQQTFIKAYQNLGRFKGDASLCTWLYRIAFNESVNFFRRRGRRRTVPMVVSSGEEEVSLEPVDEEDPSRATDRRELHERVQAALQELEEESRQIVILREFEGMAYDEIAGLLRIPVGTVRSKLHRARRTLKARLEGERSQNKEIR